MMKKVVMFALAFILLMIAIANLGPIVGLLISIAIAYVGLKQFLKTDATIGKLFWGLVILICISSIFANVPALAGITAIAILYIGYKKWSEAEADQAVDKDDPFTNFERQWEELSNHRL